MNGPNNKNSQNDHDDMLLIFFKCVRPGESENSDACGQGGKNGKNVLTSFMDGPLTEC